MVMNHFLRQPRHVIVIAHDALMAAFSFAFALYLRLSMKMFHSPLWYEGAMAIALVMLAVLLYSRSYRRVWRYTSLSDLLSLAQVASVVLVIFYLGMFQITRLEAFPRSVFFIHWMTLMVCLAGPRMIWRLLYDRALLERLLGRGAARVPVLLIGATPQAEMFIREAERNADFPYRAVGIIDEDKGKHGREIHRVRVYGNAAEVPYILRKLERKKRKPQRMVLSDPTLDSSLIDSLLRIGDAQQITLARLPGLGELRDGNRAYEIQPVAVEDILGRSMALLDKPAMREFITGKRIMVTGAGGSIGSELVRQIVAYQPALLVLYELSEYPLYEMDLELARIAPNLPRQAILGDVRNREQLDRVLAQFTPEIVFHAAAIKHVPLSEANPDQAVLTNVLGTKQVADACLAHGVAAMVMVSTDKAVNPTSVMGASKRAAEMYCQALARQGGATHFITVRFGNVLNSAGSVVPLFQKQLARGGPLTVTHKDMVRYFMTIGEAVQLVLQAAVLGSKSAESATIYVLDMGAPIRIEELACQMIRLAGLKPYEDIAIVYTGLRPGEKLFEELFHGDEQLVATSHQSIRKAEARGADAARILAQMQQLIAAAGQAHEAALRQALRELIPEYDDPTLKVA
jgi:O-antigen biosynthesis protein WbqV